MISGDQLSRRGRLVGVGNTDQLRKEGDLASRLHWWRYFRAAGGLSVRLNTQGEMQKYRRTCAPINNYLSRRYYIGLTGDRGFDILPFLMWEVEIRGLGVFYDFRVDYKSFITDLLLYLLVWSMCPETASHRKPKFTMIIYKCFTR